jgi:hypothetical protein
MIVDRGWNPCRSPPNLLILLIVEDVVKLGDADGVVGVIAECSDEGMWRAKNPYSPVKGAVMLGSIG